MELTTNIQDCLPFGLRFQLATTLFELRRDKTTQQAGSVDFAKSTALSSACRRSRLVVRGGKVLQLRTCCLVSSVNSTLAKSRGLFSIIQL